LLPVIPFSLTSTNYETGYNEATGISAIPISKLDAQKLAGEPHNSVPKDELHKQRFS
jgi:hypothetical protein